MGVSDSNSAKSWTELTNHMVAYIEGICSNKVEEALEPTRAEYERRCKKLQAAHDGCCGWGLCLVMLLFVIAIGAFWGKLCQKRPQGNGRVRCIETSLLLAVFLLISLGAYQLTTRIVECGVSSRASEIADAPNKHSAVLCAYNQLSDEMERWFALFAVLGTFFGLVLPVGSYLLQIKAVDQHEDNVKKTLNDEVETAKDEWKKLLEAKIKEAEQKLGDMSTTTTESFRQMHLTFEGNISKLWQQQGLVAQLQMMQYAHNIAMAWRRGNNDSGSAQAFFYWSLIFDGCGLNSKDIGFMGDVSRSLFMSFNKLFNDPDASKYLNSFAEEIGKITRKDLTRLVVLKDALTGPEYERFAELLAGLGISLSTDTKGGNQWF